MTDQEMRAARALCEAATPGPWEATELVVHPSFNAPNQPRVKVGNCDVARMAVGGQDDVIAATFCTIGKYEHEKRNAAFIAAARTLLPAALDEIERLKRDYESLAEAYRSLPALLEKLERDRATTKGQGTP